MLALNGIFLLVTRHGLEYPAFYKRLYGLLAPEAFLSKHRCGRCTPAPLGRCPKDGSCSRLPSAFPTARHPAPVHLHP
jgi:hypothetical protein